MNQVCNSHAADLRRRATSARSGFTLIELSVVLVVMSLVFVVILPAMQQVRQRESHERAAWRLQQIAAAMFQFHDAHGAYPGSFEPLQPVLDENLWTAIVNDQAVDGSNFRLRKLGDNEIALSTAVSNPMRITQRLSMTLRLEDAIVFQTSGEFPRILSTTDEEAAIEHAARMHQIMDGGLQAARCTGDFSQAEAQMQLAAAWQDVRARQNARDLLDQDNDGYISRSEVFDLPWDSIPIFGKCLADFIDFAEEALAFEEDEPDYFVRINESLRWHHALLDRLYGHVGELREAGGTTYKPLTTLLDHVGASLRTAQLPTAVRQVGKFEHTVKSFVLGRVVPEELGSPLLTTATLLDVALLAQLFAIPDPARPLENPVVLRVDWRAAGPGSLNDPFPNIVSALAYAAEQGFPAVEIAVRPGTYRGSLAITRHTRIRGDGDFNFNTYLIGRVENNGPFALELINLWLTSAPGVPGVISVNHADASTYLSNLLISDALGNAVHQRGGDFRCHRLTVDRTRAFSADLGVAMQFDGGVQVELKDVQMGANRAGALLLSGAGTRAYVNELDIYQTRANAYALDRIQEEVRGNLDYDPSVIQPGTCALDVRNGAYLEGEYVRLIDNEYVGLMVHSLGRAVLSNSRIASTSQVTQVRSDQNPFGHNVAVFDQGSLTMTLFTVSHAIVGFHLAGDIEIRLRGTDSVPSVISNCDAALALGEGLRPDFDLDELEQSVDFRNNTANVRATTLPTPGAVPSAP